MINDVDKNKGRSSGCGRKLWLFISVLKGVLTVFADERESEIKASKMTPHFLAPEARRINCHPIKWGR